MILTGGSLDEDRFLEKKKCRNSSHKKTTYLKKNIKRMKLDVGEINYLASNER